MSTLSELRKVARDLRVANLRSIAAELYWNSFCPTGKGGGRDPTCSPGSSGAFHSDFESAFTKAVQGDRVSSRGPANDSALISMEDIRRLMPKSYSREDVDKGIRKLREAGKYTMETAHGKTTPEMREAGIREGSDNLIWISKSV